MLSKILLALNPVSPANWLVLLCVYCMIYKQYIDKQKFNKYIKYGSAFFIYMILTIPIYMILCMAAGYIPPLRLFALFCEI